MDKRSITPVRFGANAQAKMLVHQALTRAAQDPDADWPLDLLFEDPEEAARRLTNGPEIRLEPDEISLLKRLGRNGFSERFECSGGWEAMRALVECLERMDMPEVSG